MGTWRQLSKIGLLAVCLSVSLLLSSPAGAAEFKTGKEVTIEKDEVIEDDLYMTGETMTVKGTVKGDVVASGKMVRIEGVVEGDVMAAGQAVVIDGEVRDDVRIAGMTLKLGEGASVGDDLFTAGFSFESAAGSRVGGKTIVTGYQALIAGEHQEDLQAALVGLRIEGRVAGDVDAAVESEAGPAWWTQFMQSPVPLPDVGPGLTLGTAARVGGDLSYKSMSAAEIADSAHVTGETRHDVKETTAKPEVGMGQKLGRTLRWFVALFLFGAILLWLVPDKMNGVAKAVLERPVASLGWGVVTLIGFPLAMTLVLVVTLVLAMIFGFMTLGKLVALVVILGLLIEILLVTKLWIAVSFLAPVVVSFAGGRFLMTRGGAVEKSRYLSLLVGLALLALFGLVPFVGALVCWLVVLIGLGAGSYWAVRYLARPGTD
ncbi:MAG: polymer-forming cytoskeletal protein [Thermoanaerobaculia bacterium]